MTGLMVQDNDTVRRGWVVRTSTITLPLILGKFLHKPLSAYCLNSIAV
jgi:hypothetical protein